MATSSITHNFVIKDPKAAKKIVDIVCAPREEVYHEPVANDIVGKDAVLSLMKRLNNGKKNL